MTIEKLQRVMERLRKAGKDIVPNSVLEFAIMYEIGTDKRTYKKTRKALKKLGWINASGKYNIKITGKDLE